MDKEPATNAGEAVVLVLRVCSSFAVAKNVIIRVTDLAPAVGVPNSYNIDISKCSILVSIHKMRLKLTKMRVITAT